MPPPPPPPPRSRSGDSPLPLPTKPAQNTSVPVNDDDLITDYPDAIKLRWRGSEIGPYSWDQIEQMLRSRQIGFSHEAFWLGKWGRLREMEHRVKADQRTLAERQQARIEQAGIAEKQRQAEADRIQVEKERRDREELEAAQRQADRDHEIEMKKLDVEIIRAQPRGSHCTDTVASVGAGVGAKIRAVYIVLALLCGSPGLHNFYARRYAPAIVQAIIFLIGIGGDLWVLFLVLSIWAIGDMIFVKEDGDGKPMR